MISFNNCFLIQGRDGADGPTGAQGPVGPDGDKGPQGAQGAPGSAGLPVRMDKNYTFGFWLMFSWVLLNTVWYIRQQ